MRAHLMAETPRTPVSGPIVSRWLWAVTAGLLAFVGSWLGCVVIVVLAIRQIPPDVPHPTEAYEGFGDAMRAVFLFYLGVGLSFLVAVVAGFVVATWVAYRGYSRGGEARHSGG
jgi:hypothetical protein